MGKIKSHRDLIVWQKAIDLAQIVYLLSKTFPRDELYGLVAQMKKSSVSIPSNIAEGRRRGSRKDFARFISIAFGSGAELETQLEIAKRLEFGDISKYALVENTLTEVMKMLNTILTKLQAKA